jgi:hypothetical protein
MPLISDNFMILGQEKKPSPAPAPEKKAEPVSLLNKNISSTLPRKTIDPDHALLNIGGKVDRKHSTYLVDMLTQ